MEFIRSIFRWLRSWVSPVYMAMLFAAFVLWFITKLGDTYTTEHEVVVNIDNVEYVVDCTIRGKGTDLVHYTLSSKRSCFTIPLTDLTQDKPMVDNDGNTIVHITAESVKHALAQRMNGVDVISVGSVPVIITKPAEAVEAKPAAEVVTPEVKETPAPPVVEIIAAEPAVEE